jgi:hypothetical protein
MQTPPPLPESPSHTLDEFVRATTQQDKGHGLIEGSGFVVIQPYEEVVAMPQG